MSVKKPDSQDEAANYPAIATISRRELLKWLMATSLYAGVVHGEKKAALPAGADPLLATYGAFIDTLIPKDDMPGAVELGIHLAMLKQAASASPYFTLVIKGCTWLDAQAGMRNARRFADLDEAQRVAVVELAELARPNSLENVFFNATRDAAFTHYYADARSWPGLGYAGPPQPRGFPDYQMVPVHAKKHS